MDSDVGKLFIGGISWETTEEKLKSYFRAYGEVVEAVIMKDRATGRARGFGFVVFADPVVADRVVQDKHTIDGRQVEAKKAVPRDEQQNAIRSNNGGFVPIHQARTKKIFVGGLAATVTEHDFRKYFDQFGAITDVVVMYDHGTQRPRGFGFITYDSEDAVDRVLQKSFHELKGKMVEVKRAIPKEMSPSPIRNNGSGLSGGPRGGGPYGGGYGQFNSSPIGSFGARMDSRYSSSPGVGYSPYAYGSNRSFSAAMNAVYDGNPHGGGSVNFGGSGGHGGALNAGDIFGGSGGGYGSSPAGSAYGSSTPGRNLWSSGAVGYGSNSLAGSYGYSGGSSVSGYGGAGTWGSAQSPSSGAGYGSTSAGYGNNSVSYGSSDGAYGSSNVNYDRRGSGYRGSLGGYGSVGSSNSGSGAHEGGYRDLYSNLGYQETTQKSSAGADPFNAANIGGLGFGGYGLGDSSREVAAGEYGSRYATGSQPHRGVPA